MTRTILEVDRLGVSIPGKPPRSLIADVSLYVAPGETVGLVGESGSGKSVTSRAALGLFPDRSVPTGRVVVAGTDVLRATKQQLRDVRARRASMVFQDPRAAINPLSRIGSFVTEGLRARRELSDAQARARAVELLEAVGIERPSMAVDQYPRQFSGGMLQRVVVAAAISTSPELLLADEPTTKLDVTTQAEIIGLLSALQRDRGTGMLFVTHDLQLAAAICDRVYVMYAGRIVESQPTEALFNAPRHPYSRALLAATPRLGDMAAGMHPIAGRPLSLFDAPDGCAFAPRCREARDECVRHVPELRSVRPGTDVACVRAEELVTS